MNSKEKSVTDFNFFKPTEEDLNEAMKDVVALKHNEEYHFIITEIKEDVDNEGKPRVVVKSSILNTDQKGKNYSLFIRSNPTGKRQWIELLSCWYTQEQIMAGLAPSSLIAKQFSSVCKVTAKEGKEYANFYTFRSLASGGADEVPF
jgi:hypothetical protein